MDRVRSGDYGACEGCETRISDRRLNAIPWARYCLTCQENVAADRDKQKEDVRLVA
ncbi:MAG: TraR/DksA family transcriptional regulator [Bryobacteraceae bacterium]